MIGRSAWRATWTPAEIKLSGVSWVIFGLAGIGSAFLYGLEFGARVVPLYWVGSPWGLVTGNPFLLLVLIGLFLEWFNDFRHWRRSRNSKGTA